MALWGSRSADGKREDLVAAIEKLTKQVAELRGEREGLSRANKLARERDALKEEIATLKIDRSQLEEDHARKVRETEHMVGLQKKRANQEQELAVKAAELGVREANMDAKENAFEERLEKVTEQLTNQIEYLQQDIIKAILARLPTFNVETALEPHRMLNSGNGHGSDDD